MEAAVRAGPPADFEALRAGLLVSALAFAACEPADLPSPPTAPVIATLDEAFAVESVITLGEDPADSIAEVGAFTERRAGGFVVADRLLPRVRSYGEDGQLEAAFGRFGDGPFEFRRIRSVTETLSGKIVVPNPNQGNLTVLTAALERDTLLPIPGLVGEAQAIGSDLLVEMLPVDDDRYRWVSGFRPPVLHRMTEDSIAWSSYESPFSWYDRPYWNALVPVPFTVAGDSIFAVSGARFPITILNGAGDTIGTMGTPSASFRPIPILEVGAFASLDYGATLPDLLKSFEVIYRIDVVGRHLFLTRARYDHTRPFPPFKPLHSHLDIYDRHTGSRIYEDIPLPEGSKVLGGGRYLYLLLNKDFPPWRIAKLRLRR